MDDKIKAKRRKKMEPIRWCKIHNKNKKYCDCLPVNSKKGIQDSKELQLKHVDKKPCYKHQIWHNEEVCPECKEQHIQAVWNRQVKINQREWERQIGHG